MGNNKTITVTAEQLKNRTPLFVKEGSIIPMLNKNISNSREAYGHDLEVRLYGKKSASYALYEDDAKTFNYLKGQYRHRTIQCSPDGTISEQAGKGPQLFGKIKSVKVMTK